MAAQVDTQLQPHPTKKAEMHTTCFAPPPRSPQATTTMPPTTSTTAGLPISLARILKRRLSFTMPGSLLPRSPSMEPDGHRGPASVRFASCTTPPPLPISPLETNSHFEVPPASPSTLSTLRRRGAVVAVATDRFHIGEADAGPTILLPSPHISPHASPRAVKGKGKPCADACATLDADSSGLLHVHGKEQELDAACADLGWNERCLGSVAIKDAEHVVCRAGQACKGRGPCVHRSAGSQDHVAEAGGTFLPPSVHII